MATSELEFARDFDLPPAIVWDALVDDVLVEGWLATARIEPHVGGLYWLDWQSGTSLAATNGVITEFEPPAAGSAGLLVVATDNIGTLEFSLAATPGGTRGSGTLLRLRILVDTNPRLQASTRAYWQSNFDQLEDLLRGHPVDWSSWQRDRGEAWARYLHEASGDN
ncbi:MAG TPA: SRPBCC domain-containing protein [Galbitalea sp.]|nr:SRPBCC domain-containing protein [Galbitalea sp.]